MSHYIVRLIAPSGPVGYVMRGRETLNREHASRYMHPSAARRAAINYCAGNAVFAEVLDTRKERRP